MENTLKCILNHFFIVFIKQNLKKKSNNGKNCFFPYTWANHGKFCTYLLSSKALLTYVKSVDEGFLYFQVLRQKNYTYFMRHETQVENVGTNKAIHKEMSNTKFL